MTLLPRTIGTSGISVNPIGLGSMPLAIQGRPAREDAIKVIHAALDAGIDFIDTADVYCLDDDDIGYAEKLIAEALSTWSGKDKTHIVVATKGGLARPHGAWTVNGDPTHLKKACEASLRALNTDCIELYQLHASDPDIPYADSVGMLSQLQKEGKIKHIGISNVSLAELKEAQTIVTIVSVQNRCNPFDLHCFHEGIINYCEQENIAFLPWSPVGGSPEKNLTEKHPTLNKIAKNHQANPFQVALAWLLAKSPVMIPIPGASKIASAKSSAEAMNLQLKEEEIAELDKVFKI